MTTVAVTLIGPTRWATLTTEHPASSYDQPVLVDGCTAYGPDDLVPIDGIKRYTARTLVADAHKRETAMPELGDGDRGWLRPTTSDAIGLVERFVGLAHG